MATGCKIHLLYQGYEAGYNHIITAAAISDDGIHFEREIRHHRQA